MKVEATVVRPVSIKGLLARVEPGTHFELENAPVAPGLWLAQHFSVTLRRRMVFLFTRRIQVDETYSLYRKSGG